MSFIFNNRTNKDLSNWYYFKDGFSADEIEEIHRIAAMSEFQEAVLATATETERLHEYRKSEIKWLKNDLPEADTKWIYQRFAEMCFEANEALWQFEVTGMLEELQYGLYRENGGHYDWHMDVGPGQAQVRKISIVLQLSDPGEYEGGVFELFTNKDVKQLPRRKGSVTLFPSYCMHRVTPVTYGERKSLVLWVSGPPFK